MKADLFDFKLPEDRIALEPAQPRDAARLLVVRPDAAAPLDGEASTRFTDSSMHRLPALLRPGDALVFNDTRVIRAALTGERLRGEQRAAVSFNLHKRLDESRSLAFARPAKRLKPGDRLRFGHDGRVCLFGQLEATIAALGAGGEVELSFSLHGPYLDEAIEALGDRRCRPTSQPARAGAEDAERLSDRLCAPRRGGGGTDRGPAFHARAVCRLEARGIARHFAHPARRCRHLPAGDGGRYGWPSHARRMG